MQQTQFDTAAFMLLISSTCAVEVKVELQWGKKLLSIKQDISHRSLPTYTPFTLSLSSHTHGLALWPIPCTRNSDAGYSQSVQLHICIFVLMSFMHGCQRSVAEAAYSAAILSRVPRAPPLPGDPAGPVCHYQMRIHFIQLQMCSRNTGGQILSVTQGSFPVCPLMILNLVVQVCFSHLLFPSVHTQNSHSFSQAVSEAFASAVSPKETSQHMYVIWIYLLGSSSLLCQTSLRGREHFIIIIAFS